MDTSHDPSTGRRLAVAESHTVAVDPSQPNYPSGLAVSAGEVYAFSARGKWKDWFIPCGPEGWRFRPLQGCNRLAGAPFFLLCGVVGQGEPFAVGAGLEDWPVPAGADASPLYLFANDWPCMYRNNKALPEEKGGPLEVVITRLR